MTYYNLDPTQASYLATNPNELVIVLPLPEQPPEGFTVDRIEGDFIYFSDVQRYYLFYPIPYPLNATVELIKRRSSKCVPSGDIVYPCKVMDVRVDRVQNVIREEQFQGGFNRRFIDEYSWFKNWFNNRYGTPKPVKKNGEFVGYRCYIWAIDSEFQRLIKDSDNYQYNIPDKTPTWKGLPLIIHVNPFVAITKMERIES